MYPEDSSPAFALFKFVQVSFPLYAFNFDNCASEIAFVWTLLGQLIAMII